MSDITEGVEDEPAAPNGHNPSPTPGEDVIHAPADASKIHVDSQETPNNLQVAAESGALHLDKIDPGWWGRPDRRIRVESSRDCPLAQVMRMDYADALRKLGLDLGDAIRLGLTAKTPEDMQRLNTYWNAEIARRRAQSLVSSLTR